ncbi:MAG: 50S ribosomal protein L4 [Patescibacteria group bacterium]|nr:50S ribosomal protein L4 [Patescibacteria group bacterium]
MPKEKSEPKAEVKTKKVEKKATSKKPQQTTLSIPVYSLDGKEGGTLELPKDLFGSEVNKALLAQAIRVYSNNLKAHFSSTKTRSEVKGSTRKIYRQKGTGGARHGSKKAPIFVGGGIALGPKFRKTVLELPKKMKKAALISALSSRLQEGEVIGVEGLGKVSGKTAQMSSFFTKVGKKNVLLVIGEKNEKVIRATRNLPNMSTLLADQLNSLEIVKYQTLMLTKEAVGKLEKRSKNIESVKE